MNGTVELVHIGASAGPQGRDVGDHAEVGEARQIVGVDELEVGEVVARVAAAIRARGSLDSIEALAHRPVADRVHVHLEAVRVEQDDRALQFVGLEHGGAVVVGVHVRLEERAGEVLEDAVGEDLRSADPQPPERAIRPHGQEVVELLDAACPLPQDVALDPNRELAAFGHRPVRGEVSLAVDPRVLPGREPELVVQRLGADDPHLPLVLRDRREEVADEVHRVLVQRPLRLAGRVALDPPAGRVRGLPRDPR